MSDFKNLKIPRKKFGAWSLIFGVISIGLAFLSIQYIPILFGPMGIYFGFKSRNLGYKTVGLIGIVFSVIFMFVGMYLKAYNILDVGHFLDKTAIISIGIFITITLLWYIWIRFLDRKEAEPISNIGLALLAGVLSTTMAIFLYSATDSTPGLNLSLENIVNLNRYTFAYIALIFFIAGPVEETIKLVLLKSFLYNKKDFNQIMDGAVYGIVVGLGFALIENLNYLIGFINIISKNSEILEAVVSRALMSTTLHVTCSGLAGLYLAKSKFYSDQKYYYLFKGLLLVIFIHGSYNAFLFIDKIGFYLSITLLLISTSLLIAHIKQNDTWYIWTDKK